MKNICTHETFQELMPQIGEYFSNLTEGNDKHNRAVLKIEFLSHYTSQSDINKQGSTLYLISEEFLSSNIYNYYLLSLSLLSVVGYVSEFKYKLVSIAVNIYNYCHQFIYETNP